ncbi:hypothetical protein GGTG_03094 [Gaeumannomyces tritici R3-111a-1]|uniref:Uncharacterized protein n=1 Tax=Gaeumannomyces tritici (strain R3-111a-1) TaxID=644352 RepID=J3NP88_GAET3|nr:hypothetical protein GGTG_03094 [Gaeumannomyces tritici R3-111a-1]EJT77991.1 hypothetical protein GGTG_03094 [Gaeumannomyces tritici R3-111a-1]
MDLFDPVFYSPAPSFAAVVKGLSLLLPPTAEPVLLMVMGSKEAGGEDMPPQSVKFVSRTPTKKRRDNPWWTIPPVPVLTSDTLEACSMERESSITSHTHKFPNDPSSWNLPLRRARRIEQPAVCVDGVIVYAYSSSASEFSEPTTLGYVASGSVGGVYAVQRHDSRRELCAALAHPRRGGVGCEVQLHLPGTFLVLASPPFHRLATTAELSRFGSARLLPLVRGLGWLTMRGTNTISWRPACP